MRLPLFYRPERLGSRLGFPDGFARHVTPDPKKATEGGLTQSKTEPTRQTAGRSRVIPSEGIVLSAKAFDRGCAEEQTRVDSPIGRKLTPRRLPAARFALSRNVCWHKLQCTGMDLKIIVEAGWGVAGAGERGGDRWGALGSFNGQERTLHILPFVRSVCIGKTTVWGKNSFGAPLAQENRV